MDWLFYRAPPLKTEQQATPRPGPPQAWPTGPDRRWPASQRLAPAFVARPGIVPWSLGLGLLLPGLAIAQVPPADGVRFNTAFIHGGEVPADIQSFLEGNSVLPGTYRVDVFVNRTPHGRRDLVFARDAASGRVEPCLGLALLGELGLDIERLPALLERPREADPQACFDLRQLEQASVDYQPNSLALNLSVPQIALRRSARGYLPPQAWEQGVDSGFVSYHFSGNRRELDNQTVDSYYLGLRNGLNLGPWRLRNESSLVHGDEQRKHFTSNRSYAQRDLTAWKAQLTLGETYSDARIFDSVRFRGAQVVSDDGMLPDSERIYAPIIRGVAESNATVEVRQNGYLLYSATVAPGPFEISDFYPSGSNGDLQVSVIEADGRRRSFTQAFAALPVMVPQGSFSYSIEAGRYDSNDDALDNPGFASTALIYGLSERITGFGGLQVAEDFQASNLGAGVNTGLGAVSADLTHSVSRQQGADLGGQSLRLRYANTLNATRTTFAIAGYRYSSEQYRSFDQHVDARSRLARSPVGRARDRFDISLSQPLASGTFSLSALEQRFWNLPGKSRQFNATYGAYWRDLSYSLSLDRTQAIDLNGRVDSSNQFTLTLSLPLGRHERSTRASLTALRDNQGNSSVMAGVSGRVLEQNAFYSVLAGNDGSGARAGSASVNSTTSVGRFEAGYSHGQDFNSWNIGARGSLVAHGGGVNLGQALGDTFALVEVPGVRGARFNNFAGVETGRNGYAVLPYAQPYRANWISLDTRRLGADVEIENALAQVVPRRGASPRVSFKASTGRRVQFELSQADGSPLPFGASVQDLDGKQLAVVDPTSRALVLSNQEQGRLQVKWSGRSCQVQFRLPPRDPQLSYERLKGLCQ